MDVIAEINKYKIVAIARKTPKDKILQTIEALYLGGIRILELTFDQKSSTRDKDAFELISLANKNFGDKMLIGAGTVISVEQVEIAAKAGAKFILSPNVDEFVIERSLEHGLVSIPGALTPTEISKAYSLGANIVKLFPAGDLGVSYIKSISAPLSHIPMMAVGGITENNIIDFFAAGICSVGIGSNIVKNSLIESGDFEALTQLAITYTNAIKEI